MENDVFKILSNRASIRAFKDEPVSDELVMTVLSAAASGPNMNNFQPVTFIEITDQAVKDEITERVGMRYIAGAPRFFVLAIDYNKLFVGATPEQAAVMAENLAWYNMTEGALISAGIALENAVLAANAVGLGAVTMAGAVRPLDFLQDTLQLPKFVKPVMGLSLGYPDQEPGVKPKLPVKGGFWMTDKYDQAALEGAVATYNDTMREYFAGRGIDEDWTEHNMKMVATTAKDNSLATQHLHDKGFATK
ncbi:MULTISPECIES: nitroreductase family protein [Weissella]|jgi:FMN reductase [NAD(P)H]|uniref:NADPH-dependent oxidoreductase n=1 Tax=Weissella cibaria TaxID=137591 RepID=A0A1X4JIS1_9LACO|nr:nitroreductase family protein [Weissella cibaria]APS26968.1 Oxygen-insensitive NADPH nitroreductase [Weissella cibaria]APU62365.1 Oxygen-insensitive NADPH nitroreductase [Weissella cibaria]APU64517.1 Oxygen-insensitive NADPH nitroreductase [Weissella cibaria]ASS52103.1 Oxygen-insensitive NADPH nitroreductase [Weissella cibaria]AVO67331.1 NADPH-dependent oxidoreductase [Weissella cibaria]